MNSTQVKNAMDSFENDDFLTAKETLSTEIKSQVNDYFKKKLDLKKDIIEK